MIGDRCAGFVSEPLFYFQALAVPAFCGVEVPPLVRHGAQLVVSAGFVLFVTALTVVFGQCFAVARRGIEIARLLMNKA